MNVLPDGVHRNQRVDHGFAELSMASSRGGVDERWSVGALIDVARRRARWILALFALCVCAAGVYAFASPSVYTATAVLVMDTRQAPPAPGQVSNEVLIDPAVIESQVETLKSDKVALDVVDKLKLAADPEFVGSGPDWKARLSATVLGTPTSAPSPQVEAQAALDALRRALKFARTGHSYLAEIAAVTGSPQKSALIANAVADAYIQDQLDGGVQAARRSSAWMKQRVDEVRQQSAASKAALDRFNAEHEPGPGGDSANVVRVDLAEAQAQVKQVELTRALLQDQISKLEPIGGASLTAARIGALSALADPELNSLLDRWKATQTPPAARAKAVKSQAERSAAENAINVRAGQLLDDARKRAIEANDSAGAVAARVRDLSEKAGAETALDQRRAVLENAAQADQAQYETLLNRYTHVSQFLQQQSLPVTQARILTYAAPPLSKSAPRTSVILLLGILGGLVLGVGTALIREALDRHIRWPHQVTRDLGIPFIGVLPVASRSAWKWSQLRDVSRESRLETVLRGRVVRAPLPLLFDARKPWCPVTEVLRGLKIAVDRNVQRGPGAVVGIVSAGDGEGKTTVTYNFARLVAETGRRVLVVDCDLRKPDLSRALVPQNAAGLSSVLAGQAGLESCVQHTEFGFDVLADAAGSRPLHAFEILGSDQMQGVISSAQTAYDCIILDFPPLLYSVDAYAAARYVDAFVLVIEYGRTTIDAVEQSLAASRIVSGRLLGAVLNKSREVQGRVPRRIARSIARVA